MTSYDHAWAQQFLLQEIKNYEAFDEKEKLDQKRFINFLQHSNNVYARENLIGHITASSWIVNKEKTKVLLIHHNIYKCRTPLGGHADNETDLRLVALQEAKEESGIQHITLLQKDILDIDVLSVVTHIKKGELVPLHFHFDVRYLLEADEDEALIVAPNETSDVRRFSVDELPHVNIDIMPIIERLVKKVHHDTI